MIDTHFFKNPTIWYLGGGGRQPQFITYIFLKAIDIPGVDSHNIARKRSSQKRGNFQSHWGVNDRGGGKAPYSSIPEHSNTPCCLSENKTPHSYPLWSILISPYEKREGKRKKRKRRKLFCNLKGDLDQKPKGTSRGKVSMKQVLMVQRLPPFPREKPSFGKLFNFLLWRRKMQWCQIRM